MICTKGRSRAFWHRCVFVVVVWERVYSYRVNRASHHIWERVGGAAHLAKCFIRNISPKRSNLRRELQFVVSNVSKKLYNHLNTDSKFQLKAKEKSEVTTDTNMHELLAQ